MSIISPPSAFNTVRPASEEQSGDTHEVALLRYREFLAQDVQTVMTGPPNLDYGVRIEDSEESHGGWLLPE